MDRKNLIITLEQITLEQMKTINCNVIVYATNTDVFFLLQRHCKVILRHNLNMSLVCWFVIIEALMNKLSVKTSYRLLALYAITSCNTIGKFNGISKEFWLKRFFENYENHAKLKNELVKFQRTESLIEEIESLICETFLPEKKIGSLGNIPVTRHCHQWQEYCNFISSELPISYEYE